MPGDESRIEETADFVEELSADFTDYADFFRLGCKQTRQKSNREYTRIDANKVIHSRPLAAIRG
jgi:hypothetical protein